ncbi:toxin-antitoxin system YwqK family antitoxin [Pseudomonas sp. JBR1]|uniref:toxin-antitoxin system YwqK family antitoxin n=1 Tax=Pseudomonas sp. JBR1 TaxID=3020907 RepID=UPI002305071C|nr:hypothetical protein [Pseudomonas sp. JBR1]WCE10978.1 hypothetical protein PJ259_01855 [Pseudomonas sp. JBR1]
MLASVLLASCSDKTLDFRNAEIANGLIYAKGTNDPLTGSLTNFPQSFLRPTHDLNGILTGLFGSLDRLKRQDESIRLIQLVCNGETKSGQLNGETNCYEPGTKNLRYQAHYNAGQLDGDLTIWGKHQNPLAKATFKNDRPDGTLQFYGPGTGKLILQTQSRNGMIDGLDQRWDEGTGQLIYQAKAVNGHYVGIAEPWDPNGTKTLKAPYRSGTINGVVRACHPQPPEISMDNAAAKAVALELLLDSLRTARAKSPARAASITAFNANRSV